MDCRITVPVDNASWGERLTFNAPGYGQHSRGEVLRNAGVRIILDKPQASTSMDGPCMCWPRVPRPESSLELKPGVVAKLGTERRCRCARGRLGKLGSWELGIAQHFSNPSFQFVGVRSCVTLPTFRKSGRLARHGRCFKHPDAKVTPVHILCGRHSLGTSLQGGFHIWRSSPKS